MNAKVKEKPQAKPQEKVDPLLSKEGEDKVQLEEHKVKEVVKMTPRGVTLERPEEIKPVDEDSYLKKLDDEFQQHQDEIENNLATKFPEPDAQKLTIISRIDENNRIWPKIRWGFIMPPEPGHDHHRPMLKKCPKCGHHPRIEDTTLGRCGKCYFDINTISKIIVQKYSEEIEKQKVALKKSEEQRKR